MLEPLSWRGADPAEAPAVVQLEGITVAHRETGLLLQQPRVLPALGVDGDPVSGLSRKVCSIRFGSGGDVLSHEVNRVPTTPCRLPRGTQTFHRNDHYIIVPTCSVSHHVRRPSGV